MSELIKHECGVALIRLLKPLSYYQDKYGTPFYGLQKLHLIMEKMINRGQDGAGVATIKLDVEPGRRYISRYRSSSSKAIQDIFSRIHGKFAEAQKAHPEMMKDTTWLKRNVAFTGELLLGHLRYGTYGKNSIENCHPFLRQNNWMTRNLVVAGNFNLTNVDELFQHLVNLGQFPKEKADTVTVMEKIGHFLDKENERLFRIYKDAGTPNVDISQLISETIDLPKILDQSSKKWDGGYVMAGLIGHGDAFVLRDPNGIRPAFFYQDEEIVVVASERPVIQTALNIPADTIQSISPGHALIIKKNGHVSQVKIRTPRKLKQCTFERIYFSRGNDKDIYQERKELGRQLCQPVLKSINNDIKNTVFSFIPNTAEIAFMGLVEGMNDYLNETKRKKLLEKSASLSPDQMTELINRRARVEKIVIKDAKLRTFITADSGRDEMVASVYDTTYGIIQPGVDNLVVVDDSIVRGTTLKQSVLRILDRLQPKKIVIVSSAPQIRYPDCYGIDMARLGDFVAFQAAVELLKERKEEKLIQELYKKAKAQESLPKEKINNVVKEIYAPFSDEEISNKISQMLRPDTINASVDIIYQSLKGLHKACPEHDGDWYFSGDYPTEVVTR
jgi:amidophosphoribosyltransferase